MSFDGLGLLYLLYLCYKMMMLFVCGVQYLFSNTGHIFTPVVETCSFQYWILRQGLALQVNSLSMPQLLSYFFLFNFFVDVVFLNCPGWP